MYYNELVPSHFDSLISDEYITARALTLRLNDPFQAYIYRDNKGSFYCAMEAEDNSASLPQINGIKIVRGELALKGQTMQLFIQMECMHNACLEQFVNIIKEILSEFEKGNESIERVIITVLNRWKYFLSEPRLEILNEEKIIGLLGELIFLRRLLPAGADIILDSWNPLGAEEDFLIGNSLIEVKSTLKEKHEHIINGIDQLKVKPGKTKYIFSLLLRKASGVDTLSIPVLLSELKKVLFSYPHCYNKIVIKLRENGYDIRDNELYTNYCYDVISGSLFEVSEEFPKLTSDHLKLPLNSRISKIRYTLDLEGMASTDMIDVDGELFFG